MVSAAGSGELLFTPRVAAQYGYALLWALLAAVLLKWFINHEIGRFAVSTGAPVLEGFARVPGPGNWAVWLILVPQAVVAVATVAGMTAAAATAVILLAPGSVALWTVVLTAGSGALVVWGRYSLVENVATCLAIVLAVAGVAGAAAVLRDPAPLAAGLVPQVPEGCGTRRCSLGWGSCSRAPRG